MTSRLRYPLVAVALVAGAAAAGAPTATTTSRPAARTVTQTALCDLPAGSGFPHRMPPSFYVGYGRFRPLAPSRATLIRWRNFRQRRVAAVWGSTMGRAGGFIRVLPRVYAWITPSGALITRRCARAPAIRLLPTRRRGGPSGLQVLNCTSATRGLILRVRTTSNGRPTTTVTVASAATRRPIVTVVVSASGARFSYGTGGCRTS